MNRHLDDEQIAAAVVGAELDPTASGHLGSCLDCRGRVAAMEELIELRRHQMASDEPDWEAQRAGVLDRLPEQQSVRSGGWNFWWSGCCAPNQPRSLPTKPKFPWKKFWPRWTNYWPTTRFRVSR